MISANDELAHVVETLSDEDAEKVLEHLKRTMPELYPDADDDGIQTDKPITR